MGKQKTFACVECRIATQENTENIPPQCPHCDGDMERVAQDTPQFIIQAYNNRNITIGELKEASNKPKFADRLRKRVNQEPTP